MAGNNNSVEAQIKLLGNVDPSVAKALNTVVSALQKVQGQSAQLNRQMGGLWKQVALGEIAAKGIEKGFEAVKDIIGECASKVREFGAESLKVAKEANKRQFGMTSLLGDARGRALSERMELQGRLFGGGEKLNAMALRLLKAGVPYSKIPATVKELEDISAGSGAGTGGLDPLASLYSKVLNRGYLDKRGLQAAEDSGVPHSVLAKILGTDDAGLTAILNSKGGGKSITAEAFTKALAKLVGPGGIYERGVEKYNKTFEGGTEKIHNEMESLMVDFGRLESEALNPLVQWFNSSGVWEAGHKFIEDAKKWEGAILDYFQTSDVGDRFKAALQPLRTAYDGFTQWINGMFSKDYDPLTGKVKYMLNNQGKKQLDDVINGMTGMLREISNFVTSSLVQDLSKVAWDRVTFAFKELFSNLSELAEMYQAIFKDHDVGKFFNVLRKYESLDKLSDKDRAEIASGSQTGKAIQDSLTDAARRRQEEMNRYQEQLSALSIKYNSGVDNPEAYKRDLSELEAAHKRQLDSIDKNAQAVDKAAVIQKSFEEATGRAAAATIGMSEAMDKAIIQLNAIGFGSGGYGTGGSYGAYGNTAFTSGGETAYGYPGDATPDRNSLAGIGAGWSKYRLTPGLSVALTEETARAHGIHHNELFRSWKTGRLSRWDDINGNKAFDAIDRYLPNHPPDVRSGRRTAQVNITMNNTFHGDVDHRLVASKLYDAIEEEHRRRQTGSALV
jgi:hypothetical protein